MHHIFVTDKNTGTQFKFGVQIERQFLFLDHKMSPKWAWPGSCELISKFWDPVNTFEMDIAMQIDRGQVNSKSPLAVGEGILWRPHYSRTACPQPNVVRGGHRNDLRLCVCVCVDNCYHSHVRISFQILVKLGIHTPCGLVWSLF